MEFPLGRVEAFTDGITNHVTVLVMIGWHNGRDYHSLVEEEERNNSRPGLWPWCVEIAILMPI